MRGKVWLLYHRGEFFRITPAYAGKSFGLDIAAATVRDHPRLCGEKKISIFHFSTSMGSPPPMRGKGVAGRASSVNPRITPAYAGKRARNPKIKTWRKDHPRLCGEKSNSHFCYSSVIGSPPPMRGKAFFPCGL